MIFEEDHRFEIGKAQVLTDGAGDVCIVAAGMMIPLALAAAKTLSEHGVTATVINSPTIKPLDSETIVGIARESRIVITAENHTIAGGLGSAVAEATGVKRAAYALLTGQAIDAKTALEYGMLNEVVPREKLIERAYQIAGHIMTQPRTTRRLTTQIVRRPWRQRITNDLDGGFGIQMFGHLAKKRAMHGRKYIGSAVDYVREGRKNNFD